MIVLALTLWLQQLGRLMGLVLMMGYLFKLNTTMKQIMLFGVMCLMLCLTIMGALWISATNDYPEWKPSSDELILSDLLDYFGDRLDTYYNPADLTECPWEKGNYVDDVLSEMDWEYVAGYIIALPDFGTDDDYEMLDFLTNHRLNEIIPLTNNQ